MPATRLRSVIGKVSPSGRSGEQAATPRRRRWRCAAPRCPAARCGRRQPRRPRPRRRSRPPSGPTTTSTVPAVGTTRPASGDEASSCSTTARSAAATRSTTVGGRGERRRRSGATARRACLAASRAVERQRASDFSARSPFQTATERDAAHGTIRLTPTSVSTSTASSPRSPFGSACTTTNAGCRLAPRRRPHGTTTVKTRLPVEATSPVTERARGRRSARPARPPAAAVRRRRGAPRRRRR